MFSNSGIVGLIFSRYYSGFQKSPEQMAAPTSNMMRDPPAKRKP